MKPHQKNFRGPAALLPMAMLWALPLVAASSPVTTTNATNNVTISIPVRSTFAMPANPKDGRDPFFPESLRPYALPADHTHTLELSALTLKGISGSPERRLAIINNHTFAAGDIKDVITNSGRVHVHCIVVNASSATIEADGRRFELGFASK